uniref:Uncharacterized protein n=1 Tax=Medicago truncatula TaxID=3880 RepID=I3SQC7_MEDTR|nr:unknown [Medicago truncatula]
MKRNMFLKSSNWRNMLKTFKISLTTTMSNQNQSNLQMSSFSSTMQRSVTSIINTINLSTMFQQNLNTLYSTLE